MAPAGLPAAPKWLRARPACPHTPPCPSAEAPDRDAAVALVTRPEQGWTLLCNGVVAFDDFGDLLPDGRAVPALPVLGHIAA